MTDIRQQLKERFDLLPKVVQDAITSATVEEHLRELSKMHQLHLDQWQELETEVMFALMGLKPVEQLALNIESSVNVDNTTAQALAQDISQVVFAPIRNELQAALGRVNASAPQAPGEPMPDLADEVQKTARPQPVSLAEHTAEMPPAAAAPIEGGSLRPEDAGVGVSAPLTDEDLEKQLQELDAEHAAAGPAPAEDLAAQQPQAQPERAKAVRTEPPETYKSGSVSTDRKDIHSDPYRIAPDA